jgi:hypothetical protein
MSWKIDQKTSPRGPQDAKACHLVKEVCAWPEVQNFDTLAGILERELHAIKRTNSIDPALIYKVVISPCYSTLQVQKLKPDGDIGQILFIISNS